MGPCASFVSKLIAAAVIFGTCLSFSAPAHAEKRVALVIGNSAYKSVGPLDNPKNDATLMAETLRSLGFTLVGGGAQLDLDKSGIDRAVQNFGDLLPGADVGLFYYSLVRGFGLCRADVLGQSRRRAGPVSAAGANGLARGQSAT